MKAATYASYGPADVVQIADVEQPAPKDTEVLLEVRAASLNPLDCGLVKGAGRLVTGLRKPRFTRLGVDVAGQVVAVGAKVARFKPGDDVFGVSVNDPQASAVRVWISQGAFAEYACAPEVTLALKPATMTFEQAAAMPVAAFTALQGLRDKGRIQPGHRVLVNGASGGVGTLAVQIAKWFGANVTGICSTRNVEMVRSLGADRVIDYTQEDFSRMPQRYDLIFDCVANQSLAACRHVLAPHGTHVLVGELSGRGPIAMLGRAVEALVWSRFSEKKAIMFLARPNSEDLTLIGDLVSAGRVKPVIDRCYRLEEISDAIRHVETKHARGKVVITMPPTQQRS
jgi:NADPH:quinone reductase-like Zn-dependent oxidoreductase